MLSAVALLRASVCTLKNKLGSNRCGHSDLHGA